MDEICDHPNWWVMLSLNGFTSHVNVEDSHIIFAESEILVVKEEGDTSHVNQAYAQFVAKKDKEHMCSALDTLGPVIGQKMDQWYLIAVAVKAQNSI